MPREAIVADVVIHLCAKPKFNLLARSFHYIVIRLRLDSGNTPANSQCTQLRLCTAYTSIPQNSVGY